MGNLVLIRQALEHSKYTPDHTRYLIRHKLVVGQKIGAIWLIDLESLQAYERQIQAQNPRRGAVIGYLLCWCES